MRIVTKLHRVAIVSVTGEIACRRIFKLEVELCQLVLDIFNRLCAEVTDIKQVSFGTLDELFTVTSMKTLDFHQKPIILWNMKGFWDSLVRCLDDLQQKGVTRKQWREYITVVSSLEEVKDSLEHRV